MKGASLVHAAIGATVLAACAGPPLQQGERLPDPLALSTEAHTPVTTPTEEDDFNPSPGQLDHAQLTVEGKTIDYGLILPTEIDESTRVLLALPPGPQNWAMVEAVFMDYAADFSAAGWAVLIPTAPEGQRYDQGSGKLIPAFLLAARARHSLPTGKVHLFGVSNGGLSAFAVAAAYPELFLNLVVMPGVPNETTKPALAALKGLKVTMVVGADDPGWVEGSRESDKTLRALGVDVQLQVVKDRGHLVHSAFSWTEIEAMLSRGL